ncbi:MAG: hypothetical protein KAU50_04445 [Candidatus Marinimicrobia bacterium]|nr:hypothetical protein [Candidatus Neomarinimicrobiota bacterium]
MIQNIIEMLEVRQIGERWYVAHRSNSAILAYCKSEKEAQETYDWWATVSEKFHGAEQKANDLLDEVFTLKEIEGERDEEIKDLNQKITRRNKQIKDLKEENQSNLQANVELHARINLLEDIVKTAGLWNYYCEGCLEYHKGNKKAYLARCPKIV